MAKFATMWVDPPVYTGQVMDVEDNVELGGYVDPRTQIEAFFEAGKRLTGDAGRCMIFPMVSTKTSLWIPLARLTLTWQMRP